MRAWLCIGAWVVVGGIALADDPLYQGKTVKEWAAALKHKEARVRLQALAALSEASGDAAPVAADILKLLKDPQVNVRRAAVQVLSGLEHESIPKALGQALRDTDIGVRQLAAKGLSEMGEKALLPLVEASEDKDSTVRLLSLHALDNLEGGGKDALMAIGKAVKDPSLNVRRTALFLLARRATDDPEARPFVAQALRDKDKTIRASAAQALAGGGAEVIEELLRATKETDASIRAFAMQALAAIGDDISDEGVAALAKGLGDSAASVRKAAAIGMGQLKGKAREVGGAGVTRDLAKLFKDKEVSVRRAAAFALGTIGANDVDEVARLADGLKDGDVMVRGLTVQALGSCVGEETADEIVRAVLTHLTAGLGDADKRVQNVTAQLLAREEKRSVPVLIPLVEKGQGKQRLWAAAILGEIGAAAADAVPALQKMSMDTNLVVRQAALAALEKIRE